MHFHKFQINIENIQLLKVLYNYKMLIFQYILIMLIILHNINYYNHKMLNLKFILYLNQFRHFTD